MKFLLKTVKIILSITKVMDWFMNPPNMFLMKSQVMKLQGNSVRKRMEH